MRILIVEDDETVATGLKRGLEAEGFGVDLAGDGDTGFWMATEHEYDVVLLDVMLPARNGYRVCRDLRSHGLDTPIFMLTAKSGEHDEAEGLDIGADDFLTKPFSFVVLVARIRALARRRGTREQDIRRVGELTIDFERRSCSRNGVTIELTNREFLLLESLARRPGSACAKDHLLDDVWGPAFEGGTNVVEVYIGYLRKKIDSGHDAQLIQTVHGHGYRLVR